MRATGGAGVTLRLVTQVVGLLVAMAVTPPRLVAGLRVLAGVRPAVDRVIRVRVLVQTDEQGSPVADVDQAREALAWAVEVFRDEAGVALVPVGWSADEPRAVPSSDPRFVSVADEPAAHPTLDVTCTVRAWLADLGAAGAGFRRAMRAEGGPAVPAYGSPVWAFAVRGFGTRHLGCSLGPFTDYVTVRFSGEPTTLAHELGHACGLWHTRPGTLMDRRPTRVSRLAPWQRWIVRASRHVTRA